MTDTAEPPLVDRARAARTCADLAELLRVLRRRHARDNGDTPLTYRELAARTGWSRGIIGEYLLGNVVPPMDRFDQLVGLLGARSNEWGPLATARDRVEDALRADSASRREARRSPRQLPPAPAGFSGRAQEMAALDALVRTSGRGPLVLVLGAAGIGKTSLVVQWAHQAAADHPDGQLFLDLRGFHPKAEPLQITDALRGFLRALGVPEQQIPVAPDAQGDLLRSVLADRRVLMVLDNARDADQVRPLLPGAVGCTVVVTSRLRQVGLIAVDGARPLTLGVLDDDAARRLLADRLGQDRLDAEPEVAASILTACGGLPLALSIVAARACLTPGAALGESLASLTAGAGHDPHGDLNAVLSWSYHQLTPAAAQLFRRLGQHPGGEFTLAAAASAAALSTAATRSLLGQLTDAHVVQVRAAGRWAMHDLWRSYAADLAAADRAGVRRSVTGRLQDHYVHSGHRAGLLLEPYPDLPDPPALGRRVTVEALADLPAALEWLHRESATLSNLLDGADRPEVVVLLAGPLGYYLDWTGQHDRAAAVQTVGLDAARRSGDRRSAGRSHRLLGNTMFLLGRRPEALQHYAAALETFTGIDDHSGVGRTEYCLGIVSRAGGSSADALHHLARAAAAFQRGGDDIGLARAYNGWGWEHANAGNFDRAAELSTRALDLQRAGVDPNGEAQSWDTLGYARFGQGRHDEAISCYRRSLARWPAEPGHGLEVWNHLAQALAAAGDAESARAAAAAAAALSRQLEGPFPGASDR